MRVDGLLLPQPLVEALESGRWPRTAAEAVKQNLHCLVAEERIRGFAPDESIIYLYHPPFHTVASVLAGRDATFYHQFGMLEQIVPEAAIEIADFGLGSDAPILLDYRASPTDPSVIRLCWPGDGRPNCWKVMAPDFSSFIKALGL